MATTIVEQSGGQYHVLVIIADGQVFYIQYIFYIVLAGVIDIYIYTHTHTLSNLMIVSLEVTIY